jgi:hypothetical protein
LSLFRCWDFLLKYESSKLHETEFGSAAARFASCIIPIRLGGITLAVQR